MKKLFYYLRLYLYITAQYIKVRMQFRMDFIISSIAIILTNITGLLSLQIIFKSIRQLAGWEYYELLFIYGFSLLALSPLQLFFDNIWSLRLYINRGDFIKYYFKPINMMFCFMSEVFDIKGLSQLAVGIWSLVIASKQLSINWTLGKLILLFFLIISASLVMVSLMIMAASTAFWFRESLGVMSFVFKFRDHSRYPLTIFNNIFRYLLTYIIPVGFISYYPCLFFLRPQNIPPITFASPIIGIVLFLIAYRVWDKGTKIYAGTGS